MPCCTVYAFAEVNIIYITRHVPLTSFYVALNDSVPVTTLHMSTQSACLDIRVSYRRIHHQAGDHYSHPA